MKFKEEIKMKRFNFMRFREAISRELMNMANDCGTADEFRTLLSTNGICLRDFFEEETAEPNNTLIDPDIEEDLFCPPYSRSALPIPA